MHFEQDASSDFVLRPSVVLGIVWLGFCGIWRVWIVATAKYPTLAEPPGLRLLSESEFWVASAVNVALFLGLLLDAWLCRRSPAGLRRGHRAGICLAVVATAALQYAFVIAQTPIYR